MFDTLVRHGCRTFDLPESVDQISSPVIASGGFGDIRRVALENGTRVAIKTLRLHILLTDKKAPKVISPSTFSETWIH